MSVVAAAIIGSAVVGGVTSSISASKTAKSQAAAANRATDSQLAMHDDTMARNEELLVKGESDYQNQKVEVENLYRSTQAELENAKRNQDTLAVEALQNKLSMLETQHNDISKQIESVQADTNKTLDENGQAIEENRTANDRRIARAEGEVFDSTARMGNNNAAVGEELKRVQALGSKPEGYDAAKSDLEAGFRDAEANLRRANGGNLTEAQKLSLEIDKAKGLGGQSANMRSGWAQQRSGMIGNLASQSNAGEMNILNAKAGVRKEASQNSNAYLGNLMNQNANKVNAGTSFLDKKLANKAAYGNSALAAQSAFDQTKSINASTLSSNTILNSSNRLAGNNVALGNLQGQRANAMGVAATANNNTASIYGNIAQTNIAGAGASANAASQAIGNIPSNAVSMYGAYNNFSTPKTTPAVTPAPTAPPPTTPTTTKSIWV